MTEPLPHPPQNVPLGTHHLKGGNPLKISDNPKEKNRQKIINKTKPLNSMQHEPKQNTTRKTGKTPKRRPRVIHSQKGGNPPQIFDEPYYPSISEPRNLNYLLQTTLDSTFVP